MQLDDKICYCYHVSLRKLANYARRERPQKASQMSSCLGAGTGCGWCIPILMKIHEKSQSGELDAILAEGAPIAGGADAGGSAPIPGLPGSVEDYAAARGEYLKSDNKNKF